MSYTNRLKTKVDEGLAVFPILPVFDVPLQCDLHTQFEFVFEGDYYPKLTSFQADIQVAGQQLGCPRHFLVTSSGLIQTECSIFSDHNNFRSISCSFIWLLKIFLKKSNLQVLYNKVPYNILYNLKPYNRLLTDTGENVLKWTRVFSTRR